MGRAQAPDARFSLSTAGWPSVAVVVCPLAGECSVHSTPAPLKAALLLASRRRTGPGGGPRDPTLSSTRVGSRHRVVHMSVQCGG